MKRNKTTAYSFASIMTITMNYKVLHLTTGGRVSKLLMASNELICHQATSLESISYEPTGR